MRSRSPARPAACEKSSRSSTIAAPATIPARRVPSSRQSPGRSPRLDPHVSRAPRFEAKIRPPGEMDRWLAGLARPLVFTNGVFDVLHRGHVTCLAQARSLGAALLVALNSDASARRLGKGADRPVNPLEDRLFVVLALGAVDALTWFDEDTPEALIAAARPEVLVKGGDWPVGR